MEQKIAMRQPGLLPMPELKVQLPLDKTFSPEDYQRLQRGFIPKQMESKWYIFLEGDWLYFHRSWTGYCIFQVRLEQKGKSYQVVETWLNRDPEQQYRSGLSEETALSNLSKMLTNYFQT